MKMVFTIILSLLILGCSDSSDTSATNTDTNIYTLTVGSMDTSQGSVERSSSQNQYSTTDQVMLTAVPVSGYQFKTWVGDSEYESSTSNPLTVITDHNITLYAKFEEDNSFKLESVKSSIDDYISEGEINYEELNKIHDFYVELIGSYTHENVMLKYLELKNLYLQSTNSELVTYATSEKFENNLLIMSFKIAVENNRFIFTDTFIEDNSFINKSSVILKSIDKCELTLKIKVGDDYVEKDFSYFNEANYTEMGYISIGNFYVNVKDGYGEYIGDKLAFATVISDDVYALWLVF